MDGDGIGVFAAARPGRTRPQSALCRVVSGRDGRDPEPAAAFSTLEVKCLLLSEVQISVDRPTPGSSSLWLRELGAVFPHVP